MTVDWQKHAALLDMQPSNRRLLQESRTPRQLSDVGWTGWGDEKVAYRLDSIICWGATACIPFVAYQLFTRVF